MGAVTLFLIFTRILDRVTDYVPAEDSGGLRRETRTSRSSLKKQFTKEDPQCENRKFFFHPLTSFSLKMEERETGVVELFIACRFSLSSRHKRDKTNITLL